MNKLAAGFLILALSPAVMAEEAARLNLKSYLAEVRTGNPEIAAATALSKVYSAKVSQSWLPMDPTLEFERMYAAGALGGGAAERNIMIRQEFRNPWKMRLQRKAADAESGYFGAQKNDRVNRTLAEARAAYYEYALAWQYERIYAENMELAKKLSKIAETRYSISQGSQSDAIKAQVELSKAMNMLITAQQEKETAGARVNNLRGKDPEEPLAEPEAFDASAAPADYKALAAAVTAKNPGLQAMAARRRASENKLALARAEYAPDFMLSWRRRGSKDAAMDGTYDVSLGLTLPLWFSKQGDMNKEARAERDMSAAEFEAAKNAVLLELKEITVKLDYYRRLKDLYGGTVLSQAELSLKASEAAYQSGESDFMDLMDANRTLIETKREYYEYAAAYASWLARLGSLTGESL
ncbi:MAG: TolC family protein [Elusimicrobiales bacterium]|nr:TolC family protein [Elusimicrobiales bacterium]